MGYPYGGWQQNPFTMVPTIADVDKVVTQPGETKWIMVQNDPVLAVKTANAIGYASSEYYRLTRFDPAVSQQADGIQYLTEAQADQKIQAAVKAEVERAMAQYQAALAAPVRASRGKEG